LRCHPFSKAKKCCYTTPRRAAIYRYRVAVPLRLPTEPDGLLDYLSPTPLEIGTPVSVSVRHHQTLGIVWSESSTSLPIESLKTITSVWPDIKLSDIERHFIEQISRYYHQPLGRIAHLAFPPDALRYFEKPPRARRNHLPTPMPTPPDITLTADQQRIIDCIFPKQHTTESFSFKAHLIHGITGSGKTEIYRHLAHHILEQGKQVLWLVPEIKLTPQLIQHLAPAWADRLVALHSHLTPAQRFKAWQQAVRGEADLIIGTRLAIFTPLPRLGLIIIDEEHDASFSQQDNVRYHARDVAVWRAKLHNCPIVLGSATPSLESYVNATQRGLYTYHSLQQRAIAGATLPTLQLIPPPSKESAYPWSDILDQAIQKRLDRNEQTLLFLNRRGYAPVLHCVTCGWSSECRQCSARMVWHKEDRRIRCHHCGIQQQTPKTCPGCGHPDIFPMGLGTQRLEEALKLRFPEARFLRVDQDSMSKKKSWEEALEAISTGNVDILIGTQMLAKGHHFPRLTLVGILGTDDALYSADYRAPEHLFAQIIQVAGRAGRAKDAGEVLIETDYPEHPLFRSLLQHDYTSAAQEWMTERQNAKLPPFSFWALVWAESRRPEVVREWIHHLYKNTHAIFLDTTQEVTITPPMPALMEKRAGWHRYYCLLQSEHRSSLHAALRHIEHHLYAKKNDRAVRWRIDIDPQSL